MVMIQKNKQHCRLRIGLIKDASHAATRVPGIPASKRRRMAIPFSRDVNPNCSVIYVMAIVENVVVAASVNAADTKNHLIAEWCFRIICVVLKIFQNPADKRFLPSGTLCDAGLVLNSLDHAYPKKMQHTANTIDCDSIDDLNWLSRLQTDRTHTINSRKDTDPMYCEAENLAV